MNGRYCRYSGGGGGGADRGIFRDARGTGLRCGSQRTAPAFIPAGYDPDCKLCDNGCGYGGGIGKCDRRAGERSGDRGSDIGGIRSEFRRSVRITDDDQFLCKRRGNRQHRQWLRRRVSGGTDQPISLPPIAQGCGRIKPHFTADFQA